MNRAALPAELSALAEMARPALLDRWRQVHGAPPPKNLSAAFLRRALAYEAQCAVLGGPKLRTLKTIDAASASAAPKQALTPTLPPGARRVLTWNGRSYHVEVLTTGFAMDGKTWTSLSAIARHITGAHWSGPQFFGLTRAKAAS